MSTRNAGALSRFAHLMGLGAAAKAADEDEDKRKDEDEKDAKAEGDDEDGDEDEDKDESAKAEGDDDEDEDKKRDDDKDAKKAFAAGRKSERARGAAIFAAAAAARNPAMAAELAFGTSLPVKAAIALLNTGAPAGRPGLSARMASVPAINVAQDQPNDPPANDAAAARQQATGILAAARAAGLKL